MDSDYPFGIFKLLLPFVSGKPKMKHDTTTQWLKEKEQRDKQ
jgi:hypothetical protein